MKKTIYGIWAGLLLAACTTEQPADTAPQAPEQESPAVAGEVMVKFDPYVGEILERTAAQTRSSAPATRSGVLSVDEVLDLIGGCEIERVFPADDRNEARTRAAGLHLWYVVRYAGDEKPEEVAARLAKLGEVQKTSLNRTIKRAYNADRKAKPLSPRTLAAMKAAAATRAGEYPYNDPQLPAQWHLINRGDLFQKDGINKSIVGADVQCEEAWKLSTGDPSIVVAVLDEGVCLTHPDLRNNLWVNEDETENSQEDNDGNGYAGDYHGYNFVTGSGRITWDDPSDSGHGSHVSGVIA
ncbi:MAG: S8 family serine peptidase, partial [Alistipes sp.]|nr:S8 family serine peptidase [Alistipes sp.]